MTSAPPPPPPSDPTRGLPQYGAQPQHGGQQPYGSGFPGQGGSFPGAAPLGYEVAQGDAKGLAVASMVLGIVATVFAVFCFPIGIVCALVGLPLGAVARSKMKQPGISENGKGMATAGIVLGIVALAIAALFIIVLATGGDSSTMP